MANPSTSPTECPCCFETYTMEGAYQPRMVIPCGHTICFTCISKLGLQPTLVCPICRKRCPSRFINETGFPINYLAISLIENQKKLLRTSVDMIRRPSVSDSCGSPCLKRNEKWNGNDCSECKLKTDALVYCFHCASPVCKACKISHIDSLISEIEKHSSEIQEYKKEAVKKIEELQKLIEDMEENCQETETEIESCFVLLQNELQEGKSKLLEILTESCTKEKSTLQANCNCMTDALEKAGPNETVSDLINEKNSDEMSGADVANLCEMAMNMGVISTNLLTSTEMAVHRETKFKFSDQNQLVPIQSLIQRFGTIKISHRVEGDHWFGEEEDRSHWENKSDSATFKRKKSFDSTGSESDGGEPSRTLRPGQTIPHSSRSISNSNLANNNDTLPSPESGTMRKLFGKKSGFGGASGVKAKVRNKLRGLYNHANLLRSSSLSRLDSYSDESSATGHSDFNLAPCRNQYATLKEKYENINGPVGCLEYRSHSSGIMDVVARYRANGLVIADNNDYTIKAYSGNHNLAITFSIQCFRKDNNPFISGIATTSDKNFILVDSKNKFVRMFDAYGSHLCDMGKGIFQRPRDVCTDDTEIFVTDSGGSCIQVFDMSGIHQRTIGSPGSGDCEFLWPSGMKMTSEGKLVVCDVNNNRIQILTKDGDHVQTISSVYGAYSVLKPTCVDIDRDNNIIILFSENRRVKIYTKEGNTITDFRIDNELNSIAVCSDGLIALIDGSKSGKCFLY